MKITEAAVRNWRFTLIAFFGVLAVGASSLLTMPRSEDPPYRSPEYYVTAVYPGTSPEDMEKLVVKPVEKRLQNLENLKRIITNIREGVAVFQIDYQWGVSIDDKFQEVTREINALRPELPELYSLDIHKASSSDVRIYQFAITGESASPLTLKTWADKLKDRLTPLKSLKTVDVVAAPEEEVRVSLDLDKLAALRLPVNRVLGALQANNVNVPGGAVAAGDRQFDVRSTGELATPEELAAVVVSSSQGQILRLGDVATVAKGVADDTYRARINGQPCVFVTAAMHDGQNIQTVQAAVEREVAAFGAQLPPELKLTTVFDQASGVSERLSRFARDFVLAILLVLLTLLPLGTRASLVVMIAIPLSLAIGLTLLNLLGYTINQLSIVGMIVALGILVDDSIVVVENTERWLRSGNERRAAAIGATGQIAIAVIGCTVLLVFSFLPLIFLPEGSGDFIRSLPMAVVMCVLASLIVALTVVPFLSSVLLSSKARHDGNAVLRLLDRAVIQGTEPLVARALRHPRMTLVFSFGLFALSLGLFPVIGQSLFPKSEKPMFLVNVTLPAGSNLDATDRVAQRVEALLVGREGVASVAANVGHSNPQVYYNVAPIDNAPNVGQLLVQLSDREPAFKQRLIDELRLQAAGIAGARIEVKEFEQGPPVDAPVAYRLFSDDLRTLDEAAAKVEAVMKSVPGTLYVDNPLTVKPTDLQVRILRDKAGSLGVSAADVARTLRLGVSGLVVGDIRVAGDADDLPIRVTLPRAPGLPGPGVLDHLFVDTPMGASVPLSQLTTVDFDTSVTQIRHYDRKRTVTVGSFVQPGYVVQRVDQAVFQKLRTTDLGPGVTFEVAGEKESGSESFAGIGTIILITVFGFIGVLILEFRSFKSLIIVLSVVPLGVVGSLLALFFAHETFSFTATIGLIALTGIEVKNSLLFVDFANLLRSRGQPLDDAVRQAGRMRFLPILLTSMTAIGGLIPLIAEYSPLYSPLALVLVGGILSSTLLARFVTPAVYKLFPPEVVVEKETAEGASATA